MTQHQRAVNLSQIKQKKLNNANFRRFFPTKKHKNRPLAKHVVKKVPEEVLVREDKATPPEHDVLKE
jgi:hypothetical protein